MTCHLTESALPLPLGLIRLAPRLLQSFFLFTNLVRLGQRLATI
jgi:hypothetical protein